MRIFMFKKSTMASNSTINERVLVTGGRGFGASHFILQLLQQGYSVRATLRDISSKSKVLAMLSEGGLVSFEGLTFIETELTKDDNWNEATKDCDYILHVASPLTLSAPKDKNEMIKPAVEGTLRVLKAARQCDVKRVVLTSNFGAVGTAILILQKLLQKSHGPTQMKRDFLHIINPKCWQRRRHGILLIRKAAVSNFPLLIRSAYSAPH